MHAVQLLHTHLQQSCPDIHTKRLRALITAVKTASTYQQLTITGMGRSLESTARVKHNIKRIDRLIGNRYLQAERTQIYSAISHYLLRAIEHPIIIVDWSDLTQDREYHILRAAFPVGGRALTLYEEIHPQKHYGSRRIHKYFLKKLKQLLPLNTVPIVVTDAGFRATWFKQVEAIGWDWIGRIRNRTYVQLDGETHWSSCKQIYTDATSKPKALGRVQLVKSNPIACNLQLLAKPKKGRIKKSVFGKPVYSKHSKKNADREREPWLIAASASLENYSAKKIMAIYSKRMEIEEAFRDIKSERYGLGLSATQTKLPERLKTLLLVGALALLTLWLVGFAAIKKNMQRHYQSNTLKSRRVLSVIYLGMQIIRKTPTIFTQQQLLQSIAELQADYAKAEYV